MPVSIQAATEFLRTLVRGIDRKADLTVTQAEGEPRVILVVELRNNRATVNVNLADVEAAMDDTIARSQLRTKVKGAIDRATFKSTPYVSTKMVRGAVVEGGFYRSNSPGGSRGGRR